MDVETQKTSNEKLSDKSPNAETIKSESFKDDQGRYHNIHRASHQGIRKSLGIFFRFLTEKKQDAIPEQIPVNSLNKQDLLDLSCDELHLIKLGHSSLLLKVYGEFWLLDPVFSERASPFRFAGPKRFHQPPIAIEDLPFIDRVLISHNHYDHLDKHAVKQLVKNAGTFYVPAGVDQDLKKWKLPADKVQVFDWWDELELPQGKIAFTPTQHFSGRSFSDGNKTLWGSWVIYAQDKKIYFSGDSGYFDGFAEIGHHYGPFDITLIETGAYDEAWSHIHMRPEESVQAHIDLQGKLMVPVHNSTFDLAFHAWYDPLVRAKIHAEKKGVSLATPIIGEVLTLENVSMTSSWWEDYLRQNSVT